ncbi:ATP-dependent DNA helicase [Streptomyces zagrosensis]|uniref:DNA 3'-5' helicase n=1 Tax=Streptomyces zagrosensis TaxID=1042984 RepID=A0A7W9UZJ9_9ACTN|nr:ATP-dependent DNA helicase [Streptomyces zagrosensis]MBB5936812.1 DNA helicase-2/ATP-dependent DNA helicase PcrA [Streptomyces zagrosensis]
MSAHLTDPEQLKELLGIPFTPEQMACIIAPLAPQVIVAGAGSGKTTVMAARVVWLVGTGQVAPEQVLGLTFTNKAAGELAERVRKALHRAGIGEPGDVGGAVRGPGPGEVELEGEVPGEPRISTYHAFAGQLLGDHGLRIGVEPGARLLADATRFQLAARVLRTAPGPYPALTRSFADLVTDLLALDGELAEHLVPVERLRTHDTELLATLEGAKLSNDDLRKVPEAARARLELLDLVGRYRAEKRRHDLLDFGDQIALSATLARSHPEVGRALREEFAVVLLDEYQDTSVAQRLLLSSLFGAGEEATASEGGAGAVAGGGADPDAGARSPGVAAGAGAAVTAVAGSATGGGSGGGSAVPGARAGLHDGTGHAVTAVGDPCQAIYGWRGASVANLDDFPEHFPRAAGGVREAHGAHRPVGSVGSVGSDGSDGASGGSEIGDAHVPGGAVGAVTSAARARNGGPAERFSLSENRRSGGRLLALANRLATPLRARHAGVAALRPAPGADRDGLVRCALLPTHAEELAWLADSIAHLVRTGTPPGEIAVLCRTAVDFAQIQGALVERDVPVEVVGLSGLLHLPEVADLVAMCEVLHDPTANAALVRLLTGPRWRIGARDLALLGRRARALVRRHPTHSPDPDNPDSPGQDADRRLAEAVEGVDPAEAISLADALDTLVLNTSPYGPQAHDDAGDELPFSAHARVRFARLATELRVLRRSLGDPLMDVLHRVLAVTGLEVELSASPHALAARRRETLGNFLDIAAGFAARQGGASALDGAPTLLAFLGFLRTAAQYEKGLDNALPGGENTVKVLTAHKSKGLEWDVVAVPGLVAKTFPSEQSRESWTANARVLPHALRGDADTLPDVTSWDAKGLNAFKAAMKEHQRTEELRLGYVTFTRPRSLLLGSGHWWGPSQKKPRGPSAFLDALREHCETGAGEIEVWAPEPAPDEENPALRDPDPDSDEAAPADRAWPLALNPTALARRRRAADAVLAHLARLDAPTGRATHPAAHTADLVEPATATPGAEGPSGHDTEHPATAAFATALAPDDAHAADDALGSGYAHDPEWPPPDDPHDDASYPDPYDDLYDDPHERPYGEQHADSYHADSSVAPPAVPQAAPPDTPHGDEPANDEPANDQGLSDRAPNDRAPNDQAPSEHAPSGEPLLPAETRLADSWDRDLDALAGELRRARATVRDVLVPPALSASQVLRLAADPDGFARELARPMPGPPRPAARRGTRFHAWVESRFEALPLPMLGPDELPGADEDGPESDAEGGGDGWDLEALKEAFNRTPYARRTPHRIEAPFQLNLAGRVVRGRIDAVYRHRVRHAPGAKPAPPADGAHAAEATPGAAPHGPPVDGDGRPADEAHGDQLQDQGDQNQLQYEYEYEYEIIDWKTNRAQDADPLQLAVYRLAWAEQHGLPLSAVTAAFLYVRSGEIVRPEPLPGRAEIERILLGEPRGTGA